MDVNLILQYLRQEAWILIIVLWFIGYGIKKANFILDKWIPLILGILGAVFGVLLFGLAFPSALQGILAAAAAVYGNQILKQVKKTN